MSQKPTENHRKLGSSMGELFGALRGSRAQGKPWLGNQLIGGVGSF